MISAEDMHYISDILRALDLESSKEMDGNVMVSEYIRSASVGKQITYTYNASGAETQVVLSDYP